MKEFGWILILAFLMVATLGHAKQSLAQPGSADAFNSRMPISGASGYDSGSNLGASKEIGEPNHAGNSGGASVWWTWTAPKGDEVTLNTQGSDFDTLLAVYTGESLNRLKAVGSNDDTGGTLQSEVRFVAQQGQTYHVAVDGYGGATGAIVLNWQTSGDQPLNVGNGVSTTVDNQILVELFPEDTTEPNPFDLDGLTLLFTPDGEGGYAREVRSLAWEADIGSAVTDGAVITLDNFGFDFAGQRWDAFHVSQHGLVTFGGPFTYSYLETGRFKIMHDVAAEFVDGPTISPLYKPMSRAWWGDDGHDVAQYVARWPDRVVVTWHTKEMASYVHGVPPENPIRFQMVLYADGGIAFNYADVALRDGIVGLFPDAEVTRGHLIARIADPTDAELPGHLDLLDVAIYESNTDALIVEWTMRDGIPPLPSGTHYSYRLYFDTDEPYFGGDEDFEFMWSVDVATDDSWTRGGRRLPTSAANRVALLVEDAAARGITASIKPDAAQFDDGRFVQGNWKSRAEQITLPSAPPRVDLSRSDGRFSSRQSEVFHYRSLRDLDSIVCRVIGTLGDEFDLFVFHSEFRTDSQESATAWRSYRGNTSITGTGGGLRPEAPCGEGRLKGRWESVIWMESDTVWTADHTRIHGVHRVRTGWDRGLTLFAHEFTHVGAAFASFVNRDGEREQGNRLNVSHYLATR